jgi:type VI secretion system protein ImpA
MSEELQNPPVVDLDLILQPIPGENPAGEDLRYSGIYDEIREARRADEVLSQGEWQTDLKVADFQRALSVAVDALTTRSKDIQIAAWLCESLVKLHGFAGLRDGLKILHGLQDRFWEQLYPEIDDGDMESRGNAIGWVDAQVALAVKGVPFTGAAGYSYIDWEDSKQFDIPEGFETGTDDDVAKYRELKDRAERERRVTADLWRREIVQTRRTAVETANSLIDECWQAFRDLNAVIEAKFDRNQAPGLGTLKKSLEDVHAQVTILLTAKRAEEPDEVFDEQVEGEEAGVEGTGGSGKAAGSGAIQGRRDALKRLGEIAEFFKRTEPHSPVSYLVQRAVKWGDMPLDSWLQEVVKDPGVLYQLKETLGVTPEG